MQLQKTLRRLVKSICGGSLENKSPRQEPPPTLQDEIIVSGIANYLSFDFSSIKRLTLGYLSSLHMEGGNDYEYAYTYGHTKTNIYNSTYACALLAMYNELSDKPLSLLTGWIDYFNSFQDPESGLFIDPSIRNEHFDNSDWWGARHLVPQIISAYTALGARPRHQFHWAKPFYNVSVLDQMIDSCDWTTAIPDENDIDNKIMNIGVAMQYQRDFWQDDEAARALTYLKNLLIEKTNPATGLWGGYNSNDPYELPRMIQFAYHLLRIFIYDHDPIENPEKIIDLTLASQNVYGGFGEKLNSSACEDIDAVDILIYLSRQTNYRSNDISIAIRRAFIFILSNMNRDGGFVFRRDEPLWYGHDDMYSDSNVSALFPTWFRTLSIAHICDYLGTGSYNIVKCPGY